MNKLVGVWQLVDSYSISEDGTKKQMFGDNPKGHLLYMDNGFFAVTLSKKDRSTLRMDSELQFLPEDKAQAFSEFFAYSGQYELLEDRILHKIEVCSRPDWIGVTKTRYAKFVDHTLILHTDPMLFHGETVVGYVSWEKIK